MNWREVDQKHIWHPFGPLHGLEHLMVESAEGIYLNLEGGRRVIDGISSWWVNLHGHSHPYIADAIAKQARSLEHVIFAGFTHEPAVRLIDRLVKIVPGQMQRAFFSDNGSTAVEVGVKMAIQHWHNQDITNKKKIVILEGAYHGDTFGTMSLSGKSSFYKPFFDYLFEVEVIPFPDNEHEEESIARLKEISESGDLGVFVYEPLVQGSAGMRMASPEVFEKLLGVAKEHGVICVADEVLTGFGRTGKFFASDYMTTKPDIVCLSKGLTGGTLAMSLTMCNEEVARSYETSDKSKTFYHGHSFTANPLACAVANASLDLMERSTTWDSINNICQKHINAADHFRGNSKVSVARSFGTFLALEINTEEGTSYFNNLRDRLYEEMMKRNVLLRPLGNVVYVLPPYCITSEELKHIYAVIDDVLEVI